MGEKPTNPPVLVQAGTTSQAVPATQVADEQLVVAQPGNQVAIREEDAPAAQTQEPSNNLVERFAALCF